MHTANIARLQRRVPKAANLLPPERDAGDRMLQRASQPRRHLPVHARRILVSGGIFTISITYVLICNGFEAFNQ